MHQPCRTLRSICRQVVARGSSNYQNGENRPWPPGMTGGTTGHEGERLKGAQVFPAGSCGMSRRSTLHLLSEEKL
jgi:hypothetical protein